MKRAAAVALAALTSACAPAPDRAAPTPAAPTYGGIPLPPGAPLDPPGIAPTSDVTAEVDWPGSLRPDDAQPAERVPEVLGRGRIVVGVDQSQYLLSYRDVTAGDLRGFEIDLAREIARDIFGDPEKVDFRFVGSSTRAHALETGDVDIVIRTMSITPERLARVDFSIPYLTSTVRLLVPKDRGIAGAEDLHGKTVCVVDGSNLVQLARGIAPDSPILRTRTWADCLMASQQFHADAVLADDAILAGMIAQDPYTEILPQRFGSQQYFVGVPKGQDGMTRQVNATIERLRRDGTWDAMYGRWLTGSLASPQLPAPKYRKEEQ
ncbi:glutamate ABC transporter substrate-binding protein [Corynebacterium liangguodongii]|uniref:ABC transporter n=1 Tax=Corynebacterium liangguodongii TaxID=2079535 RepID=A0A2S0WG15_9CORY|nr:glutamate ABC transporter substrate-binding protein [Corynebacterium liangguodongii]AWB84700.1 ABC transporter [Corynebacterium liangguodongii]PWB99708.1 ABC transporter [Corynebacterium liangguodongii]